MPVLPADQLDEIAADSTPRTAPRVESSCIQSSTTTCPAPASMPPPTPSSWSPAGQLTGALLLAELNGLMVVARLMSGTAADADWASARAASARHSSSRKANRRRAAAGWVSVFTEVPLGSRGGWGGESARRPASPPVVGGGAHHVRGSP